MVDNASVSEIEVCSTQETDPVVHELELTRMTVRISYNQFRSWRAFSRAYGLPHNVLYAIGQGDWSHVSWETLRLVRRRLGLPDPGPLKETLCCPSCGGVHAAGDCHGQPIAAIVVLAPGETVKPAPKNTRPRRRYHRPCLSLDLRRRIPQLEALLAAAISATKS